MGRGRLDDQQLIYIMPVTKTAKRALRSSKRKEKVNKIIKRDLEVALRVAKKKGTKKSVKEATSLIDRAAKKGIIHKNKAARIKSRLSKTLNVQKKKPKTTKDKSSSKKK